MFDFIASFDFSTIQLVCGVYGLVVLWSIKYLLQIISKAHTKSEFLSHLCLFNVNSFPLSVKTLFILKGKKSIAFSKNIDEVSALLFSCISK